MFDRSSEFSLDDLRVEEEEVRTPTVFPLSIFVSETEFLEPVDDVEKLKEELINRLLLKYPFRRRKGRTFKEGFLEFKITENGIECFYAKECPTKITFEMDDMRIHEERLRLINPAFSVKIKINLRNDLAKVVLFGGNERTISTALTKVLYCIRGCIKGGHRTISSRFSREEMNMILKNFGINVEYIWISPGDSEKFMKIVEKTVGGKIKRVPEYIVHAKLRGYRIMGSPITLDLIEESGIYLREIQGSLPYGVGTQITVRVSSFGRILMYIPENVVPKDRTIYDVGEDIFSRIVTQRKGPREVTINGFLPEES